MQLYVRMHIYKVMLFDECEVVVGLWPYCADNILFLCVAQNQQRCFRNFSLLCAIKSINLSLVIHECVCVCAREKMRSKWDEIYEGGGGVGVIGILCRCHTEETQREVIHIDINHRRMIIPHFQLPHIYICLPILKISLCRIIVNRWRSQLLINFLFSLYTRILLEFLWIYYSYVVVVFLLLV